MSTLSKHRKQQLIIIAGILLAIMIAAAYYMEFIRNTHALEAMITPVLRYFQMIS